MKGLFLHRLQSYIWRTASTGLENACAKSPQYDIHNIMRHMSIQIQCTDSIINQMSSISVTSPSFSPEKTLVSHFTPVSVVCLSLAPGWFAIEEPPS